MPIIFTVFLCLKIAFVFTYLHEKPLHNSLWPQKCNKGQVVLNDCNWCWCDSNKYSCNARVCSEVDVFGHFNDAIQDINVGMEGHGVWRSSPTACDPLVQYKRGDLNCVCGEDGTWPNPTCRDAFRVLHEVDISIRHQPLKYQRCIPTKLYLIGCKVCFCPSTSHIDPDLCTARNCSDDEPILYDVRKVDIHTRQNSDIDLYSECKLDEKYKFGCRSCKCLSNNRLLCDNCNSDRDSAEIPSPVKLKEPITIYVADADVQTNRSPCPKGHAYKVDCNFCFCLSNGNVLCSTAKCSKNAN